MHLQNVTGREVQNRAELKLRHPKMESFQDVKVLIEVAKCPAFKTLSHTYKAGQ